MEIGNVNAVLTQLNAEQLFELREKLNVLKFAGAHEIKLGSIRRYYYNETYGFYDGDGHSNTEKISYSEIFLYNTVTERDALTGENLDQSYQTHFEDFGNAGELYTFVPNKEDGVFEMTLESQAKKFELPFQEYYSEYEVSMLLDFYSSWLEIQIKNGTRFHITRNGGKIILPYRQYEKTENGIIKAMRSLQFF